MSTTIIRPVPTNYSEVFSLYYPYIIKLVRKAGIDSQNVEDVAMQLLTKFYEKDVLSDYNPEFTSSHSGVVRSANFNTFLAGFVFSYIRYLKGRQELNKNREPTLVDSSISSTSENSSSDLPWIVQHGLRHEDTHEELELEELILRINAHLARVTSKSSKDRCDLGMLFTVVQKQIYEQGKLNVAELAEVFGVSATSIQNWMKRLRGQISLVMEQ